MTAELWLFEPCAAHGIGGPHLAWYGYCPGGSRERLNPEQVVFGLWDVVEIADAETVITVASIIDALGEE